ncbi:MAG: potassium-transporting ATPase subunit KdpC [Caldisericales bacterium]|nr:potassium-transporting ATPase subunit KdpC [Caldisericales bacterium]
MELKRGLLILLAMVVLTGIIYPLAVTGIGQLFFSHQANGSLIAKDDSIIGSELIAQKFEVPFYFVPRPSAINYDAATSGGTNNGPTSEALKLEVGQNVSMTKKMFGLKESGQVPADMVTSSGSGLDPEISFDSAMIQARSVANARKVSETEITKLVEEQATKDLFSPKRVNVLLLNLELDRLFPKGTK